jgi:hypothetical protein
VPGPQLDEHADHIDQSPHIAPLHGPIVHGRTCISSPPQFDAAIDDQPPVALVHRRYRAYK